MSWAFTIYISVDDVHRLELDYSTPRAEQLKPYIGFVKCLNKGSFNTFSCIWTTVEQISYYGPILLY